MNREKTIIKVSNITILGNALLFIFKLLAGIFGHSKAMVSDAIHSLSDVLSTIIVIVGVKISSKKSDKDHQYGHEKFECIAALLLAYMLFAVSIFIGYNGIVDIVKNNYLKEIPTIFSLVMALISILGKEIMYWYTIKYAKKYKSDALKADAWHHRSDALSSIGALIGIAGSMCGLKFLDALASIIIAGFIIKVSIEIFIDAVNKIIDKACDPKTEEKIRKIINNNEQVIKIDLLKTRIFGPKIYVDCEISLDQNMTLQESHAIAEEIHDELESKIKKIKHCMIHVNPLEKIEDKDR